ncbi:hypothetical protein ACJX0J_016851, partial [Zea mays]
FFLNIILILSITLFYLALKSPILILIKMAKFIDCLIPNSIGNAPNSIGDKQYYQVTKSKHTDPQIINKTTGSNITYFSGGNTLEQH